MSDERHPGSQARDLNERHRRLKRAFVHGWVIPARGPVTFDEEQLARIEHVRDHGGWLYRQEADYLPRLRTGARRGDTVPPPPATREPYVDGFREDFELRTVGSGDDEHILLREDVETGARARQMPQHP